MHLSLSAHSLLKHKGYPQGISFAFSSFSSISVIFHRNIADLMAKIRNIFETRKNIRKKCTTDLIMLFKAGQISMTLREWDDTIQLDKIIEMVIFIRDNYTYESESNIPLSALYLLSLSYVVRNIKQNMNIWRNLFVSFRNNSYICMQNLKAI